MANRLARESSPYLRQHQHNPVDWYPWSDEALKKAKSEDKPIFLSIGYAACHWCHVMERESFEDGETAELMNRYFVNIKVDREERPDLDGIYMQAVVALTRHGGWPMSVFLTPDGEPFYGGTYFPPAPRYQMPSFKQVLTAVADAWEQDRENVRDQAGRLSTMLREELGGPMAGTETISSSLLDNAAMKLAQAYDWKNGGWGKAPKFPQPMTIEFLLRKATRGDKMALQMAEHALDAMGKGGMYDVVGGGFARYSVDDHWLVPHFEKMLYDNAQLARVYLYAWLLTKKPHYRRIVEETLDFVMREMTGPEGGFYSSLDADSEGVEGKFYVWTLEEITKALPDPHEQALVIAAYGITKEGNFEGKTVLQRKLDDAQLAGLTGVDEGEIPLMLTEAHAKLLSAREERVRPGTDDKCVTSWNGLMLSAFSEAGRYLENDTYKSMAMRNGRFLLNYAPDSSSGRLNRTWRAGQSGPKGFLEDYAAMINGLISLYQTDPDPKWFAAARKLTDQMIDLFSDPAGGFFDTGTDHETLIVRPRDIQDNATPSGGSLAALALLAMAAYTGDGKYTDIAAGSLSPIVAPAGLYPTAFANWLCAADTAIGPMHEIVLVGDFPDALTAFTNTLWNTYRPRLVAAVAPSSSEHHPPPVAENRPMVNGQPTAYVCEGFVCLQPAVDPAEFAAQLS